MFVGENGTAGYRACSNVSVSKHCGAIYFMMMMMMMMMTILVVFAAVDQNLTHFDA